MVGRYLSISTLRRHNLEEDIHYTHDRVRDCRRRYRRCSACASQIAVFTISPVGITKQINQTESEKEERVMWKRIGVDVGGLLLPPSPGVLTVPRGGGFNSDNGDLIGGSRGGFAMGMGPRRSSSAGLMSARSSL